METDLCYKCNKRPKYVRPDGGGCNQCSECLNQYSRDRHKRIGRRFMRYGLTTEDIYYMWLFQGGRCSICQSVITVSSGVVDHDSSCCPTVSNKQRVSCGKCVLGLLCHLCNRGLGHFKDNCTSLKNACNYLESYTS